MQFNIPFVRKWSEKPNKNPAHNDFESRDLDDFLLRTADEQLRTLGPIALSIGTIILIFVNTSRIREGDWAGFAISVLALAIGWFVVLAKSISALTRIAIFITICYVAAIANFFSYGLIDNGRIVLFYACVGSVAIMRNRYSSGILLLSASTIFIFGIFLIEGYLDRFLVIEHPEFTYSNVFSITLYFTIFAGVAQFLIITIYRRLIRAWRDQLKVELELRNQNRLVNSLVEQREKELRELQMSQNELAIYKTHLEEMVNKRTFELNIERDKADQANQAKSNFVARMSHELRTPLNAIMGYSQLLIEELEDENVCAESLTIDLVRIEKSGTHLLDLINNVLDLSKIEASKMLLSMEECSLVELIEEVDINTRPLSEVNRNRFIIQNNVPELVFETDHQRFKQILINLIGNAFKFTTDGEVVVEINTIQDNDQTWLDIDVKDTGMGMSEEFLERIFDPFVQENDTMTRGQNGSGLGMAIAKSLAELMGGELNVYSKVGEGSIFTLLLPVTR